MRGWIHVARLAWQTRATRLAVPAVYQFHHEPFVLCDAERDGVTTRMTLFSSIYLARLITYLWQVVHCVSVVPWGGRSMLTDFSRSSPGRRKADPDELVILSAAAIRQGEYFSISLSKASFLGGVDVHTALDPASAKDVAARVGRLTAYRYGRSPR